MTGEDRRRRDRHGFLVDGQIDVALDDGWELARAAPGAPGTPPPPDMAWIAAIVPGTVGSTLGASGDDPDTLDGLDAWDWWYRCRFRHEPRTAAESVLRLEGLATAAEVWLNGQPGAHVEQHVPSSRDLARRSGVARERARARVPRAVADARRPQAAAALENAGRPPPGAPPLADNYLRTRGRFRTGPRTGRALAPRLARTPRPRCDRAGAPATRPGRRRRRARGLPRVARTGRFPRHVGARHRDRARRRGLPRALGGARCGRPGRVEWNDLRARRRAVVASHSRSAGPLRHRLDARRSPRRRRDRRGPDRFPGDRGDPAREVRPPRQRRDRLLPRRHTDARPPARRSPRAGSPRAPRPRPRCRA